MGEEQIYRLPGRSNPRPYNGCGVNENPQRVEDSLWIACVGDAPVVVSFYLCTVFDC